MSLSPASPYVRPRTAYNASVRLTVISSTDNLVIVLGGLDTSQVTVYSTLSVLVILGNSADNIEYLNQLTLKLLVFKGVR